MNKTQQFIEKAKSIHGDLYDYSGAAYTHSMQPLTIICPVHGPFEIRPNNHLSSKQGCQKCSKRHRPTLEEFKQQAAIVHNNRYDYADVVYVNNKSKISIKCMLHGSFLQTPKDHIHNAAGCPRCKRLITGQYHKNDTAWFTSEGIRKHSGKYDYSKVDYKRYHDKVEIVCPTHGSFFQTASSHIHNGNGCPICSVQDYEGGYGEKRFQSHPELKNKNGMLYIIRCRNADENFIKIGITQYDLKHRFHKTNTIPYQYEEVAILQGSLYESFKLEQSIKKSFKQYKYRPTIKFNGYTECLSVDCQAQVLNYVNTAKEPSNEDRKQRKDD